ncbi:transporter substrate-binding domain-containing protein [Caballeronia grimmiae]|uniref:Amino acid ABC transporter n=2 Tax=Caballeronia grimmiae TaxID=1071679 RepID=A0ABQ1RPP7_9BURK|nr:amino acid ABC transporter [Caballeronia grimmiae]
MRFTVRAFRAVRRAMTASSLVAAGIGAAHADATLDKINARHELVVGVMITGGPFGSIDPATQKLRGINVDIAQELAKRLNVDVQLVSVQPSTRVQFLQQGKVDILVANMEYTEQRNEILDHVPTPYYQVGGTAITSSTSGITRWEDLRGKQVCISQGSSYIKPVIERFGAVPRAFPSAAESLLALKGGNCVAAVHDAAPLLYPLVARDPEWRGYRTLQPELIPSPSVIWARQGEKDTVAKLDPIVRDWHRTGWLIGVEAKNGLTPPSPALAEWHAKYASSTVSSK